ncbi:MAG TPA: STAS domain-containing protein [Candidatus Limnocylindria bacterium]|jgi:anti-sigma B factor antagonist|nr:STAS domain-containing protein [Candidatus Limnocylindria bacterium]
MKFESIGDTLKITGLVELSGVNAPTFGQEVRAALLPEHRVVELDFSQGTFLDSTGISALIALHKALTGREGCLRLTHPSPVVLHVLELTRLDRLLQIVRD